MAKLIGKAKARYLRQVKAYNIATRRLRASHRVEFEQLYAEEKLKAGVTLEDALEAKAEALRIRVAAAGYVLNSVGGVTP